MSVQFIPIYSPLLNTKIGAHRGVHFFLFLFYKHYFGTRKNALGNVVLMCTHSQCFEQNIKTIFFTMTFSCFTAKKKSLFIARACFRMS